MMFSAQKHFNDSHVYVYVELQYGGKRLVLQCACLNVKL